jgi:hypothetical protein
VAKTQTITITLTDPQFHALADAVAARLAEFEGEPGEARRIATLDRAWEAVRTGWHRSLDGF